MQQTKEEINDIEAMLDIMVPEWTDGDCRYPSVADESYEGNPRI